MRRTLSIRGTGGLRASSGNTCQWFTFLVRFRISWISGPSTGVLLGRRDRFMDVVTRFPRTQRIGEVNTRQSVTLSAPIVCVRRSRPTLHGKSSPSGRSASPRIQSVLVPYRKFPSQDTQLRKSTFTCFIARQGSRREPSDQRHRFGRGTGRLATRREGGRRASLTSQGPFSSLVAEEHPWPRKRDEGKGEPETAWWRTGYRQHSRPGRTRAPSGPHLSG